VWLVVIGRELAISVSEAYCNQSGRAKRSVLQSGGVGWWLGAAYGARPMVTGAACDGGPS